MGGSGRDADQLGVQLHGRLVRDCLGLWTAIDFPQAQPYGPQRQSGRYHLPVLQAVQDHVRDLWNRDPHAGIHGQAEAQVSAARLICVLAILLW